WMVGPCFAVSRLQGSCDQSQEAIVADVCSKDVHEDGMIEVVEASFDVAFDKPFRPYPHVMYCGEGRLASPVRSEAVAVFRELSFVVRFQDGSYYFLYHFI